MYDVIPTATDGDIERHAPLPPETRYRYAGPPALSRPIASALERVVDPEIAMNIVDVGLVRDVTVTESGVTVLMTMTSAACPVVDLIVGDVETELDRVVPPRMTIRVQLVWQPPWSAEAMSARARAFVGG